MSKPYFPDEFTTEIKDGRLVVKDKAGAILHATDLRWLSNQLLTGGARNHMIGTAQRAAAGAAISHLLALHKDVVAP
jgi:hypothetical protein